MSQAPSEPVVQNVVTVKIEDEMKGAYLDYAMSVIVGRALPDVRDGLKPVHRRLLFAMNDMGNTHDKPYKKSARVVGDVLGKYHPHGDVAVYDTVVRMAQDFSLRYPLVDGQGNFGSIDGDSPAAMRYTEVRMSKLAEELLSDIEKETVDFGPNYDDSLKEPLVLPTRVPNLLVNGSSGIAVGMATNIPPHNLSEIVDATIALIDRPSLKTEDLLTVVKGPDFPTRGIIIGLAGVREAYRTGRGTVVIRGKTEIEPVKDRERIIVTELPYQVNKARLIEKIADLVRDKKIEGISDLRDESDRTGMRVVIDLKRGENSGVILNHLYKLTQLQESFGINLLAIHQGQPKTFNLRDMIWAFVEHRKDVVTRRTVFELAKAEARAHILEGLKTAVDHIDEVIELIKAASSPDIAKARLRERFSFSEIQAQAILDMRLQRLTGLERDKIQEEYRRILALVAELKEILANESRIFGIVKAELLEIKKAYGDDRRTEISHDSSNDFEVEDLISDEETLVSITHTGYVKRSDPRQFRSQHRGGRGVRAVTTHEEDFVTSIYRCSTLSNLLCFTDQGRVYRLKVFKVPEATRVAKGRAIVNLIPLQAEEKIKAILPVRELASAGYVVMVTRQGVIKKSELSEYQNIRTGGIIAIAIDDGDEVVSVRLTTGSQEILLCTRNGVGIRFDENQVRPMGRSARGVTGMTLDQGDVVVAMEVLNPQPEGTNSGGQKPISNEELLVVSELGYGKRTDVPEIRKVRRGGRGVYIFRQWEKTGAVVGIRKVAPNEDLMIISNKGQVIRTRVGEISEQGRYTGGVRLMAVENGEQVVAFEPLAEYREEDAPGGESEAIPPGTQDNHGGEPSGTVH